MSRPAVLSLSLLSLSLLVYAQAPAELIERLESAPTNEDRMRIVEGAGADANTALVDLLQKRADDFLARSDYPHATKSGLAALAVAERLHDSARIGRIYYSLGQVYYLQGQMGPALELFRKGVEAAEAAGGKRQAVLLLRRIAASQFSLGNLPAALEADQRGMEVARETGDPGLLALMSTGLGGDYMEVGQYRKAAEMYDEAWRLADASHNEYLQRFILKNLAVLYRNQGDPTLALSYLERVQKMPPDTDQHDRADNLRILSLVYDALGREAQAIQAVNGALQIAHETGDGRAEVMARVELAWILHKKKATLRDAVNELEKALEISRRLQLSHSTATILRQSAWFLLDLGESGRALALVEEAVDLAPQTSNPNILAGALNAAGHVYRRLNRREDAESAFRRAIATTEAWRGQLAGGEQDARAFISDQASNEYHELLVMRAEDGDLEGAIQLAERAKARQLLDSLAQGHVETMAVMSEAEKLREQELSREAAKANAALAGHTRPDAKLIAQFEKSAGDLEAFRARIYSTHPELKVHRGESDPVTLEQAKAILPGRQSLLLEFVVDDDWTAAFALERGDAGNAVVSFKLLALGSDQLQNQIEKFRHSLATRDLAYRTSAELLYRELLAPFRNQMKNKKIVGIVPDGPLWNLPFQALVTPDGKHVIEQLAVFYAPSLTTLRETGRLHRTAPSGGPTLLAIGPARSDIPLAAAEVRELARLYGSGSPSGSGAKVLTGDEALETRWKQEAPGYRILHVATHGILNGNNPMFSYLELKADSASDGMLEAREILDLDLHAELAVLSACETARGETRSGEGLVGMGWALIMAGTPSVVVSQWKVDSASTTQLMLAFHRDVQKGLARPGPLQGKAESLRRAANELIRTPQYQHPFYWAGFQLLGDGY